MDNSTNFITLTAGQYYREYFTEFHGDEGHDKLIEGLKKFVQVNEDEKGKKIFGIDVGTCIGKYLPNYKEVCKNENLNIIAFEPNPVNIDSLVKNSEYYNFNNYRLYTCGLSNIKGKSGFFNSESYGEWNPASNGGAGLTCKGEKIGEIEITTLDDILKDEKDYIIKFIKIDVEGQDTKVIKGMGKTLDYVKYLIFECSDCLYDHRGPGIPNPTQDIVEYLDQKGFDTYKIGTKKLLKMNQPHWDPVFDEIRFHANCFSIKKEDNIINKLIDTNFNYIY